MDDSGVIVPPELARQLVDAAVLGLADRARRNGGTVAVAPGLRDLLGRIDASANGHPFARMETSWLAAGEAAQLAGVSSRHMRRLAASGKVRRRRRGRDWEVDADSARDYGRERRARNDTGRG